MKTHFAIQGHPRRSRRVTALANELIEMDIPSTCYISDKGTWENMKSIFKDFLKMPTEYTHLVVLQDDVLLSGSFRENFEKVFSLYPSETLSFYTNNPKAREALEKGIHWLVKDVWFGCLGFSMPRERVLDLLNWVEEYVKPSLQTDDQILGMYHFYNGLSVYNTVPSLIDHLGWRSTSLREFTEEELSRENRVASTFAYIEREKTPINWETESLVDLTGENQMFCSDLKKDFIKE